MTYHNEESEPQPANPLRKQDDLREMIVRFFSNKAQPFQSL
jgi:hypothetical protein